MCAGRKDYTSRGLMRVHAVVSGYLDVDDKEPLSTVSSAFVENCLLDPSLHPSSYTGQTWAQCSSHAESHHTLMTTLKAM